MSRFVNILLFSCNLEIRIRFRCPVKRVKRSYNYLSFCNYSNTLKYQMNNYLFNGTNLMRILSYVVFMRMFKIGIHSVSLKGILH